MTPRGGLLCTVAAAALVALAPAATLPALTPAAYAQETGTITVNLVESVGADWFAEIGDRDVVVRRIPGIDPTTSAGQEQLNALDIPLLVRDGVTFPEVARTTTSDGKAQLTGIAPGAYLVEVLDSPGTHDARVSYSPAVAVLVPGAMSRTVAPKAQVLGAASNPLTACTTPRWLDASAPGKYVEYDYAFNVPNPSTDGTISTYEVTFEFSPGHTVKWEAQPVVVRAAAAGIGPLQFEAAGETITLEARAPWWKTLIPDTRETTTVVKLTRPTLTLVGAGKETALREGSDYTVDVQGNDSATFTLTAPALTALAAARVVDPRARLEVSVPALTNMTGPWGTVARGEVLGTLETTATLRTDGMDAQRTAVEVSNTSHVNVVSRKACDPSTDGGTDSGDTSIGGTGSAGAPGLGSSGANASGGHVQPGQPGHPSQPGDGRDSSGVPGQRSGLASTGAGVIGLTGIALLLILVGIILRCRKNEEDQAA
ncbi:hypothetical protein SAMN04488535_1313 [Corynebacterium mycetoides]|uniref:Uncharacterized protein n=1 Tax=Corynebacterium mycetoides TaxID=38302 RepID=A0A1G9P511_9CORY|nr:hypothetical protein [Corynebacterium mycetoides]SDL93794.1 hypothetical protein SAMN04488535_1313 [Corynebacterium mycetoides]